MGRRGCSGRRIGKLSKINMLCVDTKDIAWAAGFFEGDGYFCLRKTSPSIIVAQVNREPLERLFRIFGGSIVGPYQAKNAKANPACRWQIFGAPAASIMMTVFCFMSRKRKDAIKRALQAWKASPGNPSVWLARGFCKNNHPLSGDNYIVSPSGHGRCRQCGIVSRRRYYQENKEKWRGGYKAQ